MRDKPFSVSNEALRLLNKQFKDEHDLFKRAMCISAIAIIEVLRDIDGKLDRADLRLRANG